MRTLRLFLYFVLGLFLGGLVTLAHAETQPSTMGYAEIKMLGKWAANTGGTERKSTEPEAACAALYAAYSPSGTITFTGTIKNAKCVASNTYYNGNLIWNGNGCPTGTTFFNLPEDGRGLVISMCRSNSQTPKCPDSTWTLSGDGTTCTRPDPCPASGTATGRLSSVTSPTTHPDLVNSYAWTDPTITQKQYGAGGTFCSGSCQVAYQSGLCITPVAGNYNCAVLNTTYTGQTCTGTTTPMVVGGSTADTPKSPPCDPGQSIIQMGDKLACLPSGQSPDTPKVTKSTATKNYPDGSTKTTTTTQTCNGAGACTTTTTVTNTAATSGPNAGGAGQAGDPGTTTDEQDESGDTSDFCAKNPSLQVCKGGIAEEGTQKLVLEEIKKLSTAPKDTDFANGDDFDGGGLEGVDSDAKTALDETYKSTSDAVAVGFDKLTYAPKAEPQFNEMTDGWFDAIPTGGCETPQFTVAGHELALDGWCERAAQISSIGAYALWFITAIGLFLMVTGGKEGT